MGIFLGLIHHPVLNRHGEISTTAVTNVDMHDIARASRTYGVEAFFLVTPIALQQELMGRVVRHWTDGAGAARNPHRAQAFDLIEIVADLAAMRSRVEALAGVPPQVVVTGAGLREGVVPYAEMRRRIAESDQALVLLFGTGHGLAPEVIDSADIKLPAIDSPENAGGYNHLSVRSAAVIVLDRLLGRSR